MIPAVTHSTKVVSREMLINPDLMVGVDWNPYNHTPFPGTDTILKINLTGDSANTLLARNGEGIMRIFFGP